MAGAMEQLVSGADALQGLLAELAAADDLITELVAENEELRCHLSGRTRLPVAVRDRGSYRRLSKS